MKNNTSAELNKLKHLRILQLKKFKSFASKILKENKEFKKRRKATWENKTIESNINAIENIIKEINFELKNEHALDQYCKGLSVDFLTDTFFGPEFMFNARISAFGVPGSIIYDINWLKYLSIGERNSIATGKKSPTILADNWKLLVGHLFKDILELKNYASFEHYPKLIHEAIDLAKNGYLIASNLFLISITESIIRAFSKKILILQNPNMTLEQVHDYIDNFQSLENVIIKPDWKIDKEISIFEAVTLYGFAHDTQIELAREKVAKATYAKQKLEIAINKFSQQLNSFSEQGNEQDDNTIRATVKNHMDDLKKLSPALLSDSDKRIGISIKTELQFLIRRFKEDRNDLMHGQFEGFNEKWKNYIYLSAIDKINDIIMGYAKIYPNFQKIKI
ncbi:MAG: hypothetical protein IPI31_09215 [Bacteroidetes bacterium]|nr:hypothetical protein [Bacteroidota bacterium]